MTRRVAVFTSNRAERGLLDPVVTALDAEGLKVSLGDISHLEGCFQDAYAFTLGELLLKPDLALVPCDRHEMVAVALGLFYNNVPFAQLHAGDTGSGVHDEVGRWIISRCASLHFCNSPESAQNLLKSGEEPWRIHLVGSTAFDDVEVDEGLCPRAPFSLVLIHPDTYSKRATIEDLGEAKSKMTIMTGGWPSGGPRLIIIGPNKDTNHEIIEEAWQFYAKRFPEQILYLQGGVPRPQFLGLMKNCYQFITNSSSALYELPAFDIRKYVPIGKRNADRKPLDRIEPGASKRIAHMLATVDLGDKLLRKKFTV